MAPSSKRGLSKHATSASAPPKKTKFQGYSRDHYKYFLDVQTRWDDNDVYGHVNNAKYLAYFDTVVNHFLILRGGLRPTSSDTVGLCVESKCQYFAPVSYPELLTCGLFVSKMSKSSIRYEIGIFQKDNDKCAAHGHFVHVFVDNASRRPSAIPEGIARAVRSEILNDAHHHPEETAAATPTKSAL